MKDLLRDDLEYKEIPSKPKLYFRFNILFCVWTSISDLPTLKIFVQTFFLAKVWLKNTLPTYSLDICPNFHSFFLGPSPYLISQFVLCSGIDVETLNPDSMKLWLRLKIVVCWNPHQQIPPYTTPLNPITIKF